jgi:hypothetical protein
MWRFSYVRVYRWQQVPRHCADPAAVRPRRPWRASSDLSIPALHEGKLLLRYVRPWQIELKHRRNADACVNSRQASCSIRAASVRSQRDQQPLETEPSEPSGLWRRKAAARMHMAGGKLSRPRAALLDVRCPTLCCSVDAQAAC